MPLTFGAATSNVGTIVTTAGAVGSTGTAGLFTGWFYPTTLTAGRYLLALAATSTTANYGCRIGTTTSTLQLSSNTGTTPGTWTATADSTIFPSGITINQWWFIAGLVSVVTGPTIAWRMWLGTETQPPIAMTITQNTAPVGTLGTLATNFIGNNTATSPTASFQGDLGQINLIFCTTDINAPLPIATAGTITTDEQLLIEQQYVLPLWSGKHPGHFPRTGTTAAEWVTIENANAMTYIRQNLSATAATAIGRAEATLSGATVSSSRQPSMSDQMVNVRYPPIRR